MSTCTPTATQMLSAVATDMVSEGGREGGREGEEG